jgi:hypothetical protein
MHQVVDKNQWDEHSECSVEFEISLSKAGSLSEMKYDKNSTIICASYGNFPVRSDYK